MGKMCSRLLRGGTTPWRDSRQLHGATNHGGRSVNEVAHSHLRGSEERKGDAGTQASFSFFCFDSVRVPGSWVGADRFSIGLILQEPFPLC